MLLSRPVLRRVAAATAAALAVGSSPLAAAPAASGRPDGAVHQRVRRGVEQQQGPRDLQRHRRPVDLHRRLQRPGVLQRFQPSAPRYDPLTGTVATGDVFVVATTRRGPRSSPRRTRPTGRAGQRRRRRRAAQGDDRNRRPRPGRLRPGHRVGHRPHLPRRTTPCDARPASRPGTPTQPMPRPAVEWDGFATDTFDGLGRHRLDELAPAVSTSPEPAANGALESHPTATSP